MNEQLSVFIKKVLIGATVFIVTFFIVLNILQAMIQDNILLITSKLERIPVMVAKQIQDGAGGRNFWEKLENELDHAANPSSDLPPEKKAKIISDIVTVYNRWHAVYKDVAKKVDD